MESHTASTSVGGSTSGSFSQKGITRNQKCGFNSVKRSEAHIPDQNTFVSTTSPFAINASCDDLEQVSEILCTIL